MAEVVACPTLDHVLKSNDCLENFAGLGSVAYFGLKSDLAEPLVLTDNVYSEPKFKAGKGLFKIECKDETNKIEGSSLGYRKGFKQTGTSILESVNKAIAKLGRGLNNLDLFVIMPDDEEFQIMYDKTRKIKFDADGIKTETGAAASDERQTTLTFSLQPVKYPNMYVTITDIDKLLEGYTPPVAG